ncbi:unnamed protein product [Acanthoscelides obtectus]|nr:unnamed protein product [Acanthoscelides obtectus]CAK1647573.1 SUMO-activating enzyme subunit 2 [Acanthoscelides obtectus]
MENLWKTRKAPAPLSWNEATFHAGDAMNDDENDIKAFEMKVWPISKCAKVFSETVSVLKKELQGKNFLVWDKDDKSGMDFVTACANIRASIFSIPNKSRFEIKSIAGNIIPAIATANAMIAGLVVLYAFRVLAGEYDRCPSIYLRAKSIHSKFILAADKQITKANPVCYVCSPKPFVNIFVNTEQMSVKELENEVLKKHLNMVAPDAVLDGKGIVVISSEEGETEANDNKKLKEIGIVDGSILKCDDFLQNYELTVHVNHYEAKEKEDPLFKVVANPEDLKAKEMTNGNGTATEEKKQEQESNEDDVMIVDRHQDGDIEDDPQEGSSSKKRKINPKDEDDDLCIIDD